MNKHEKFLQDLVLAIGPSGNEKCPADVWMDYVRSNSNVKRDVHGNTIASVGPEGAMRVMLAAHIDEIGYMVRYIDDKGFLFFSAIGGIDPSLTIGQKVLIATAKGNVIGVVGKKPIHLMDSDELKRPVKLSDMCIDIGAGSKKEAEKVVSVGDVAVPVSGFDKLGKDKYACKSFDDRAGAYVAGRVIEELAKVSSKLNVQFFSVATVQEEIGLRGARTSAFSIDPDVGIAVDVTFATDFPGIDPKKTGEISLGKGPVIAKGPNINKSVFERLLKTAKSAKLPYQIEGIPRATGTDANAIQITRGGVAAGLISLPLRYMHSPVEVVSFVDLENAVKLITAFVKGLKGNEVWNAY